MIATAKTALTLDWRMGRESIAIVGQVHLALMTHKHKLLQQRDYLCGSVPCPSDEEFHKQLRLYRQPVYDRGNKRVGIVEGLPIENERATSSLRQWYIAPCVFHEALDGETLSLLKSCHDVLSLLFRKQLHPLMNPAHPAWVNMKEARRRVSLDLGILLRYLSKLRSHYCTIPYLCAEWVGEKPCDSAMSLQKFQSQQSAHCVL